MNNIDLTPIIEAFIALLAAIVTHKVIPWIKARTTAQQQETMRGAVKVLVYAAEQIYGCGKGREKMQYVRDGLRERGFDVDIDEIEAAVKEMGLYTIDFEHAEPCADVPQAMNDDTPPVSMPAEWPQPLPEDPEEPQTEIE